MRVDDGTDYTVKSGDTLGHIALRLKVDVKDLKAANPNVIPTRMKIGQKLKLPIVAIQPTTPVTPSLPAFPDSGAIAVPSINRTTGLPNSLPPLPPGVNR